MTILIDSREKGNLPKQVKEIIGDAEITVLDAGDYWIPKEQGFILIERSTYADFIGKIVSGRLWEQMRKCTEASDDVYFVLENPYMQKFSKVSYKAIVGAKTALSRHVKIFETRNASETLVFIKKLYDKYNNNDNSDFREVRVKPKSMTDKEQARFCLMGIRGIGQSIAEKLLESHSLAEVVLMTEDQLEQFVGNKLLKRLIGIFTVK